MRFVEVIQYILGCSFAEACIYAPKIYLNFENIKEAAEIESKKEILLDKKEKE